MSDAIEFVRDGLGDGVDCPCCGQFCKVYKRKLNAGMARALVWLVQSSMASEDPYGWINVGETAPAWLLRTKELATTRHWGLIERRSLDQEEPEENAKRTSGIWRPLPLGVEFVYGRADIPRYVFLYDNTLAGVSFERVRIEEALGDKFDYHQMMAGRSERILKVLAAQFAPLVPPPPPLRGGLPEKIRVGSCDVGVRPVEVGVARKIRVGQERDRRGGA